ncbi:Amino acid ABC transporter, permease protein [Pseudomonas savastanoi pv. nerii]|uniref:Amino acid ABC transporter, permease protein n=1 Tax=Pseudomonas savastanoi pv. nerii TaxID=360921 RepID=A0AB74BBB8_PSESS|nr:ABC transporter permease subunit [Pseudomonas savastanoi]RMT69168.1 Amino acid ABC transporter, permease protein [Pseudomonas savastanoi pv. nerii]
MNWEVIIKWLPRLAQGATLTLELVAIAVIAGLILAIPMGIARASRHWPVRALPYAYIFFFRGTPLLVQLFLVYYGLAQFDVVRQGPLWPYLRDPFWCAVVTMTLLELTGMARTIIARTYLPVEIFFAAGMFYLVMTFVLVQGFRLLEKLLRVDASQGR